RRRSDARRRPGRRGRGDRRRLDRAPQPGRSAMRRREVVVVTGASAGVGRATVQRFARAGADVGLIARGDAGLEGARADVEAAGGRALVLPVDTAEDRAVENAAERVAAELGPIDVWVNDAMTTVFAEFEDITADEFRRVTEVTYLGFVNGTRAALRRMRPRNRGTIVQVGSALAYRGIPLQSAYCGAKHAIQGFTEAVRCELLHDRSRVWLTMGQLPALNTPRSVARVRPVDVCHREEPARRLRQEAQAPRGPGGVGRRVARDRARGGRHPDGGRGRGLPAGCAVGAVGEAARGHRHA